MNDCHTRGSKVPQSKGLLRFVSVFVVVTTFCVAAAVNGDWIIVLLVLAAGGYALQEGA